MQVVLFTDICRFIVQKRILAITLLLSLVLPFAGTYGFLKIQKEHAKQDAMKRIKHERSLNVVLFRLDAHQLQQLRWEHDHEFELDGDMYDVTKKVKIGDQTWIWCFKDSKETRIKEALAQLNGKWLQGNSSEPHQTSYVSVLKMPFFFCEINRPSPIEHGVGISFLPYRFSVQENNLTPLDQPPQFHFFF